jgi:hypothetical protein
VDGIADAGVLLEDDDRPALRGERARGREARGAGSNDDDIPGPVR